MKTEQQMLADDVDVAQAKHRGEESPIYTLHHVWNYDILTGLMATRDMNIEEKQEVGSRGPAIVTASGPSLDRIIPRLNEIRTAIDAKIWVGNTQLWSCYHQGVLPDYVVKHDPWPRRCPVCQLHGQFTDDGRFVCSTGQPTASARSRNSGRGMRP